MNDAGEGLRLQESPVPPAQWGALGMARGAAVRGDGKQVMDVGVFIFLFSSFYMLEWGEVGRRSRVRKTQLDMSHI